MFINYEQQVRLVNYEIYLYHTKVNTIPKGSANELRDCGAWGFEIMGRVS